MSIQELKMLQKICDYGCGQEAKHQFKNGKWCCSRNVASCSRIIEKNIEAQSRSEVKEKIRRANSGDRNAAKRPEVRKKLSEDRVNRKLSERENNPMFGRCHREDSKQKMKENHADFSEEKHPMFGKHHSEKTREKISKTMNKPENKEKLIRRMLNGGAIYANSFIKNPSRPQRETFRLCQQVLPAPMLNYPDYFTGYCIDIAEPKLAIAIEVDGSYWHRDQKKDLKRQKKLEDQGWRFIRYRDKVPTLQNLTKDILGLD